MGTPTAGDQILDHHESPSSTNRLTLNNIISNFSNPSRKFLIWILIILLSAGLLWWVNISMGKGGLLFSANVFTFKNISPSPTDWPFPNKTRNITNDTACPIYFKWIYEDLRPWTGPNAGITKEMITKGGKEYAHFRIVILQGKLYVEHYKNAYQTRDLFTIWGFAQLLRLYPGKVPDLELIFGCEDRPLIDKRKHKNDPPPLFVYSGNKDAYAIVFPDWSFWGWPEVNLSPWRSMLRKIKEKTEKSKWKDRVPLAYWKGNSWVGDRRKLMKCNSTHQVDWNARLYEQDWGEERRQGYKNSNLEDQCTHSEKYILACGSTTLLINPSYYDFFSRGLQPLRHFWPVRTTNECRDIKFAVAWGNNHKAKLKVDDWLSDIDDSRKLQAQAIGDEGARFTHEQLKMELVYDYMLHLLEEYAKLLKFKPSIDGAVEITAANMSSKENGLVKEYMEESLVKLPTNSTPCTMPGQFDPVELQQFEERQDNVRKRLLSEVVGHPPLPSWGA
ncbi:hypothetical protein ACFE04_026384 [Oxalis oulophora]